MPRNTKKRAKHSANGVSHAMHIAYMDTYANNIIGRSVANFHACIPSFNLRIIGSFQKKLYMITSHMRST
jgi:hypothetical protein